MGRRASSDGFFSQHVKLLILSGKYLHGKFRCIAFRSMPFHAKGRSSKGGGGGGTENGGGGAFFGGVGQWDVVCDMVLTGGCGLLSSMLGGFSCWYNHI